ncbi:MAG TPA: hypothetical protein VFT12_12530 [Thermoanaerobaculia bacterium]|nr:hypothetical protein [Thermoanaerobaculia bacterium]
MLSIACAAVLLVAPAVLIDGLEGHQHYARVSPDGSMLAFSWMKPGEPWQIFVQNLRDGSPPRQITRGGAPSRGAAWSPDGSSLVFERDRALWVARADGSVAAARVDGADDVASFPDWSPDGQTLVYGAGSGTETYLAVIAVVGGTPRRLTDHRGGEWFPRWSPDGQRIAFYSTWNGEMTDIWTIRADGSDLRRITRHPGEDFRPAWSPDGQQILFTSRRGGKNDLWMVRQEGGEPSRLTDAEGIVLHADWLGDRRVIFGHYPSHPQLYAVDVLSGGATQITSGPHDNDEPAFSPDGAALAFTTTRFSPERGLALMDWRTGTVRPLHAGDGSAGSATWSPDGRLLAYVLNRGGFLDTRQLWVSSRDGSTRRQLTVTGGVSRPAWSSDGKSLFYRTGDRWWRVDVDGGEPHPVRDGPDANAGPVVAEDGRSIVVSFDPGTWNLSYVTIP